MPSAPSAASHLELNATSRLLAIEDQERLVRVRLGVRGDFFRGQRGPRHVAAGRVADQRGEIADEEHDVVAEILQLPQLVELHRMAEMQVRRASDRSLP